MPRSLWWCLAVGSKKGTDMRWSQYTVMVMVISWCNWVEQVRYDRLTGWCPPSSCTTASAGRGCLNRLPSGLFVKAKTRGGRGVGGLLAESKQRVGSLENEIKENKEKAEKYKNGQKKKTEEYKSWCDNNGRLH